MVRLFKILFWLKGYIYGEYTTKYHNPEMVVRVLYAHKSNETMKEGYQCDILTGKYSKPFMDRWIFFKQVGKPFTTKQ